MEKKRKNIKFGMLRVQRSQTARYQRPNYSTGYSREATHREKINAGLSKIDDHVNR